MQMYLVRKQDLFVRKLFQVHTLYRLLYLVFLRPGDELLYITGKPYDTLEEIVGIRGNGIGSLKEFKFLIIVLL